MEMLRMFKATMINDFLEWDQTFLGQRFQKKKKLRVSRLYPHNIFSIVLAFQFFTILSDTYIKLFDDNDTSENDVKNDQKEGHRSSLLRLYVKNISKKKRFDRFFFLLCVIYHHHHQKHAAACGRFSFSISSSIKFSTWYNN